MLKISGFPGPELLHSHQASRKCPSGVQAGRAGRKKLQPGPASQKDSPGGHVAKTTDRHTKGVGIVEARSPEEQHEAWSV